MRTKNALSGLSALAHEGRLGLFRTLVKAGPDGMAAGDIAVAAGVNFTTASAQLSVLANAGLIAGAREGRSVIYSVDYGAVGALLAFLMEDCCQGRAEILTPIAELANKACCEPSTGETP